jgi:hypothetical protein
MGIILLPKRLIKLILLMLGILKVVLSKVGHMSTNKSPLYLPWLLINRISDNKVVMSQVYKFHSHIVLTSQSINKTFGAPNPSCFVYKQVMPNLIKTTLVILLFGVFPKIRRMSLKSFFSSFQQIGPRCHTHNTSFSSLLTNWTNKS